MEDKALVLALGIFALRELYMLFGGEHRALKQTVQELRLAVQALQIELSHVHKDFALMRKLHDDVDAAWKQIRMLRARERAPDLDSGHL